MEQPDFQQIAAYLRPRPERTVTLTFDEIERVLGGALPLDAYELRQWWLAPGNGLTKRLQSVGWRVQSVVDKWRRHLA